MHRHQVFRYITNDNYILLHDTPMLAK